jgi:RND family efflux transporter MFP subunit
VVREGDRVRKGDVLVRIDPSEVEAQVRQQRAAVAEARYRLAQAKLTQNPTTVGINTQIRQQKASVASARAEYNQVRHNADAQLATVRASVTDYQGRVQSAEASIENAKAAIDSANANLDNAKSKYNRVYDLYKQGFIAAQEVDDAKAAVSVQQSALEITRGQLRSATAQRESIIAQKKAAEQQVSITEAKTTADIEAAKAKLEQAFASVDYAQANTVQKSAYQQSIAALQASVDAAIAGLRSAEARRADTVLRSPMDGVVTGRYLDPGAVVTAGQAVLSVQFMHQIWVSISVPEELIPKLHLGQQASIQLDAYPKRPFTGSIIQINPAADAQSRQFTVRVILDNHENQLHPGMFARVSLITDRTPKAIVVPREAIQHDRSGEFITVVPKNMKAERRFVTTGASGTDVVAITQGIKPGEKVVVMSASPVKEGQLVRAGRKGNHRGGQRGQ